MFISICCVVIEVPQGAVTPVHSRANSKEVPLELLLIFPVSTYTRCQIAGKTLPKKIPDVFEKVKKSFQNTISQIFHQEDEEELSVLLNGPDMEIALERQHGRFGIFIQPMMTPAVSPAPFSAVAV